MPIRKLALAAILVVFVNPSLLAADKVFRCVQSDGRSSFQQAQCAGEGVPMELDTVMSGWTSLRAGEKSLLQTYRKRDAARVKKRTDKAVKKAKPAATTVCWNKRKQLEAIQARLRRGYKPSQGEGLRRKRDNYTEYLGEFCP